MKRARGVIAFSAESQSIMRPQVSETAVTDVPTVGPTTDGPVWVENTTWTADFSVSEHPSHCSGCAPILASRIHGVVQPSEHLGLIPKSPVHFMSLRTVLTCPVASASLKVFRGVAKSSGGQMAEYVYFA